MLYGTCACAVLPSVQGSWSQQVCCEHWTDCALEHAGQYVTESISEEYLQQLEASHRLVERKRPGVKSLSMTGTL